MIRVGSLFSGAGGLDVAVESITGGETVWHSEVDPHASAVLATPWPGVPNHGDLTVIDWSTVEPVDVLCGGFPCQDISQAGRRAGMGEGTRSGLWSHYVRAIEALRPRVVVVENVKGLLSITAPDGRKGIQVVTDDLAAHGYGVRWTVLPASAIGTPHRRDRVFILASLDLVGVERIVPPKATPQPILLPTPVAHHSEKLPILPTPQARGGKGENPNRHGGPDLPGAILQLLPTPNASDGSGGGMDPRRPGRQGHSRQLIDTVLLAGTIDWGKYEPAIARWEKITRPAPYPVEPNRNGKPRLNPAFSEWMMGWPKGWVTDLITVRKHAFKIVGNGVVAHQAEAALRLLDLPALVG